MPWLPCWPSALALWHAEGGPGSRGGGPAPRLAGNTASLGSQSQSDLGLCFPGMRFERGASKLQTDVSSVPGPGERWWRLLQVLPPFSPEQTAGVKNLALLLCGLSLLLAGEGRMVCQAPEMHSCFSADSRGPGGALTACLCGELARSLGRCLPK